MSDTEKDKSSFTGSPPSSREKIHSYRNNGGKRSRNYRSGRNARNGNGNSKSGNETGFRENSAPIDLSNIQLTTEEKKDLDLKNLKVKRHSFSYEISSQVED